MNGTGPQQCTITRTIVCTHRDCTLTPVSKVSPVPHIANQIHEFDGEAPNMMWTYEKPNVRATKSVVLSSAKFAVLNVAGRLNGTSVTLFAKPALLMPG